MKVLKISVILLISGLIISGCKAPTKVEEEDKVTGGKVILNGQVLNSETNNPVDSAVVRVLNIVPEIIKITDSQGKFTIEINIDSTMEVKLVAFKEGYDPDTTTVFAVPGRTINVPPLRLKPVATEIPVSGEAASIVFISQSAPSIGVRESGAVETVQLVFEVQDSTGRPVDLAHSVEVKFRIGAGPGGGEFIYPESARTDNNGRVSVNLSSGTKAGVVQIIAEANVRNKTIRSKPVAITIHGGLPDSLHFSVAPEKLNFPGYVAFGLTNKITAYVGDKYGNPVKPGTAVYFTTTGGIIEGSAFTDVRGQASVNLISAAPMPVHPELGPGFATITAKTVDENQNTIKAETVVLFSGAPVISIDPDVVNVPNAGSQTFTYTVSDHNGNPLSSGTSITVEVTGENIRVQGDVSVTLPDTQDKGWTRFSFTIVDAVDTVDVAKPVLVKITTSGPNGLNTLTISGTAR
jgi:hypothetical protein